MLLVALPSQPESNRPPACAFCVVHRVCCFARHCNGSEARNSGINRENNRANLLKATESHGLALHEVRTGALGQVGQAGEDLLLDLAVALLDLEEALRAPGGAPAVGAKPVPAQSVTQ